MKYKNWKYLIVVAFIGLYSLNPFLYGYTTMAIFPVLLGLLLYFLFAHKNVFHLKTFLKLTTLAMTWLGIALILWVFAFVKIWDLIDRSEDIIPYISEYDDCILGKAPTNLVGYFLWLIICIIIGLIIFLIAKWKRNKNSKINLQ
jgi:amino acid transporter